MKEKWDQLKNQITTLWNNNSKTKKTIFIGIAILLLVGIIVMTIITSSSKFVPLYSNLSIEETGQIKEELDSRNVPYDISDGGKTIKVPEEDSEKLLVDLAGEDIPRSGHIDYSFFSENTSWGITDNEFNMMKLDAMQTELANLIKGIDGIEDAKVMITLPEESVFVSEADENSSASIVIDTKYGHEFEDNQIKSLYNLVSQAVPNLSEKNIVITNQYFEYFELASNEGESLQGSYSNQQGIKRNIEKDIQQRLQQMIGAMVGMQSVIVSVTADVDFTQKNTTEELVEPVDVDNMEGIPVSIETIQETFEGDQAEGGVVGTGEEDIPNYPAAEAGGEGDYELVKETVNNELNHIHNEIREAPYKLRDLGIQVAVDNVKEVKDDELQLLNQAEQSTVEEGINSILDSMITTSIDKEYEGEVEPAENISIVFQSFEGRETASEDQPSSLPIWVYIVGTLLILAIVLLLFFLVRKKSAPKDEEIDEVMPIEQEEPDIPDIGTRPKTETELQKEQLEKMAKENPDDFAKLLRSWISDD